ncbi:MAG: Hpt domain-containing protein, partial [Verrucomicrobiota bacterium]
VLLTTKKSCFENYAAFPQIALAFLLRNSGTIRSEPSSPSGFTAESVSKELFMPDENSMNLGPDLLSDFFAECEEHLDIIRQSIVSLEQRIDEIQTTSIIERLFRSFHSLKGIIGMVGIQPAERLAHSAEDYLREISRNKERISDVGLDLLASSAQFLEQSVVAFRDKTDPPDATQLLAELDSLVSGIRLEQGPEPVLREKSQSPLCSVLGVVMTGMGDDGRKGSA